MTHITEDRLLAIALEMIDDPAEQTAVATHLAACSACRERLERVRSEVAMLGGLAPRAPLLRMPVRRRPVKMLAMLQAAALLAIGFGVGLQTAARMHREPPCVLPACLDASPPPDSVGLCAVPDATSARFEREAAAPSGR